MPAEEPPARRASQGAARRCAVLGSPIAHSLSPVLHRAAYRALDLDWQYDAYEVTEAELAGFIAGLDARWRGLSLTMPLKREVIRLCDRVESLGRILQSINTVVIADGQRSGYNTDVPGMVAAFKAAGVHRLSTATVVGGGATAASSLAAVAQLGAYQVTVVVRTPDRARQLMDLAAPLNLEVNVLSLERLAELPSAEAVVSTIPAEAQGPIADAVVASSETIFDVVYHPTAHAVADWRAGPGPTSDTRIRAAVASSRAPDRVDDRYEGRTSGRNANGRPSGAGQTARQGDRATTIVIACPITRSPAGPYSAPLASSELLLPCLSRCALRMPHPQPRTGVHCSRTSTGR